MELVWSPSASAGGLIPGEEEVRVGDGAAVSLQEGGCTHEAACRPWHG